MQKDDNIYSALRDKFKDAEVKAPSGAWKVISSRLDDIEGVPARREPAVAVWAWTGAALAAAAVALAIILTGTFGHGIPQEQLAQAVEPETLSPDIPTAVGEGSFTNVPLVAPELPAPAVRTQPSAPVEMEIEAEEKENRETEVESDGNLETEVKAGSKGGNGKIPSIRDGSFVAIASGDDAAKKGLGLYLSGSVTGNSGMNSNRTSYTGGLLSSSSGDFIQETGTSIYGVPFSVGIGARYHFNEKISLGAGIDYSLLTRSFAGAYRPAGMVSSLPGDAHHTVHYLGIPVNVYYNFIETSILRFYAAAGGEIEFCLGSKYRFTSGGDDYYLSEKVKDPLFSLRLGVGIEFKINSFLGFYIDPCAYYCFYSRQPKSIRTERPFNINVNAGFRFNLFRR